jgi:holo-[acyl-carrier protein] synthase
VIAGIGTDLVAVSRVAAVLARHDARFVARVLVPEEQAMLPTGARRARWLAKRWAAKEAVAKAFGTGIGARIGFQDIVVGRDADGAPNVTLRGRGAALARARGVVCVHLSLSDEGDLALAFVVLAAGTAAV